MLVLSFLCELLSKPGTFETLGEAGLAQFQSFGTEEIQSLNMPDFYKEAIAKALNYDQAGKAE